MYIYIYIINRFISDYLHMSIPNSNDCCPCTVSQVPYAPAVAAAIWTLALSTSSESEVGQLWS